MAEYYKQSSLTSDLYEINKDSSNLTQLTHDDLLEASPAYSPDGNKIVYVARTPNSEGRIYLLEGTETTPLIADEFYAYDPVFAPDGSKIVFTRSSELFVMNPDGSEQKLLNNSLNVTSLSFSPDGRQIAFLDQEGAIVVMDANGTNPMPLPGENGPVNSISWSRGHIPDPIVTLGGRVYKTVSGQRVGVAGALVTRSGSGQTTTTTDLNGNYEFAGLTGGKYQIAVAKDALSFAPSVKSVEIEQSDVKHVNFQCFSLSGQTFRTAADGARKPIAGVQISLNGVVRATTDLNGFYQIEGVAPGNYTITGRRAGWIFATPETSIPSTGKLYSPNGKANLEGFKTSTSPRSNAAS